MPKATISTYATLETEFGEVKVDKIISEQEFISNITKEVNFGKYCKKLHLNNKTLKTDSERDR